MPVWLRHEHEARYQWISTIVQGQRVVDAACGTGYGADLLLAAGASSVDGFDVAPESIDEAVRLHATENARFEVADATALPVPDSAYDVYLSFETIEHIDDDRAYLREAVRIVKSDGVFVCSTPNRDVTNPGTAISGRPFNPFHVREYSLVELESLLLEFFAHVTVLGQTPRRLEYVRLLNRIGQAWPMLGVRVHQVRKVLGIPVERVERHWPGTMTGTDQPEVLVAVCSHEPFEPPK